MGLCRSSGKSANSIRRMDVALRKTKALHQDEAVRLEELVRESETLKARLGFHFRRAERDDAEYGPSGPFAHW